MKIRATHSPEYALAEPRLSLCPDPIGSGTFRPRHSDTRFARYRQLSARSISVRRCPRPVRSARNSAGAPNELDHLTGIRTRWSSRLRRMTMTYADKQRPRRCLVSWIECHQQRRAVRRRRRALPLPTSVAMHFGKRRQERQRRRRESICRSRGQGR
jgi:hypothetical protein